MPSILNTAIPILDNGMQALVIHPGSGIRSFWCNQEYRLSCKHNRSGVRRPEKNLRMVGMISVFFSDARAGKPLCLPEVSWFSSLFSETSSNAGQTKDHRIRSGWISVREPGMRVFSVVRPPPNCPGPQENPGHASVRRDQGIDLRGSSSLASH